MRSWTLLLVVVIAVPAYTFSASKTDALKALLDEALQRRDPEKRGVWKVKVLSPTSVAINLQRDTSQNNGLWMVEYRSADGSTDPKDWTEAVNEYKKWNLLYIPEYGSDYEGWVKIDSLTRGATYEVRSLYKEDASSAAVVDGVVKSFTMPASKRYLETLEKDLLGREVESEKRGLWRMVPLTPSDLAVNLQRTQSHVQSNGLWMVEYRSADGSTEPKDWTEALNKYKRWNLLYITEYGSDYKGWVKISGLTPGATYEVRTLYKMDASSDAEVDGDIQTQTMPESKRLLKNLLRELVARDPAKRGVWRTKILSPTSVAVNLQRDMTQTSGQWMVEYKSADGSTDPKDWTEALDQYKKWNLLTIDEYGSDYEGWVKIDSLTPGATYEIRSLYKESGSPSGMVDGVVKTVTLPQERSLLENEDTERLLGRMLLREILEGTE